MLKQQQGIGRPITGVQSNYFNQKHEDNLTNLQQQQRYYQNNNNYHQQFQKSELPQRQYISPPPGIGLSHVLSQQQQTFQQQQQQYSLPLDYQYYYNNNNIEN
jgi:hypothetical protein